MRRSKNGKEEEKEREKTPQRVKGKQTTRKNYSQEDGDEDDSYVSSGPGSPVIIPKWKIESSASEGEREKQKKKEEEEEEKEYGQQIYVNVESDLSSD